MPPFWHLQHIGHPGLTPYQSCTGKRHRWQPSSSSISNSLPQHPPTSRQHKQRASQSRNRDGNPPAGDNFLPSSHHPPTKNCSQGRPNPAGNNTRQPQSTPQHVKTFIPHSTQPAKPSWIRNPVHSPAELSPLSHTLQGSHTQTKSSGSLLRRLRLPLPLTERTCRCRRILDPLGDHRAACSRAAVLRSRGVPLEHAAARVCREAGARVTMHTRLNPAVNHMDDRAIEVIAHGLPPPMAGFPIGGGHNPSLPPHKCSRTTAERGQVRRDSLARCTTNKRTHLPRIGGVGTVPSGGPGNGSRWEMERGGSTVPPTVGTNQNTVNPPDTCDKQLSQHSFPGGRPF